MALCVRCLAAEAPEPLGLCSACAVHVRVEMIDGMSRLRRYLAAWAAFTAWLERRGMGRAT